MLTAVRSLAGEAETVGASEDTVDGEGLEFRTPKGGVSIDTLKSSEPVKSTVIGKAPSKLKESAGDGIYVLDNGTYLCCLHHQAHPIFRKLIGQLLEGVELFLFMVAVDPPQGIYLNFPRINILSMAKSLTEPELKLCDTNLLPNNNS